jgi:glycosyltransferase involved in cell wall biosynthesis
MSSGRVLSVIIPAYNEAATVGQVLERVREVKLAGGIEKEVVVVNDGSTDATAEVVRRYMERCAGDDVRLLDRARNEGKGAAIRAGLKVISGDFVIIQDADLETNPEDYNGMLARLIEDDLPVLYGSRFLKLANRHSSWHFYVGGRVVSLVANVLYGQRLTDEPTCYKLFRTDFIRSIPLRCKGFEFCPEVTAKVAKRGIRIREVAIDYFPRSIAEGKKIKWTDGLWAIWTLIKYRFIN